jgi:hypothetical protein
MTQPWQSLGSLGNPVVRGIMWCFLRAGTRKKHHMCSHTPEIPNEPISTQPPKWGKIDRQ